MMWFSMVIDPFLSALSYDEKHRPRGQTLENGSILIGQRGTAAMERHLFIAIRNLVRHSD
jgi:hypothetical protein